MPWRQKERFRCRLGKTFLSPRFGGVVDKLGVSWMVVTEQPQQQA